MVCSNRLSHAVPYTVAPKHNPIPTVWSAHAWARPSVVVIRIMGPTCWQLGAHLGILYMLLVKLLFTLRVWWRWPLTLLVYSFVSSGSLTIYIHPSIHPSICTWGGPAYVSFASAFSFHSSLISNCSNEWNLFKNSSLNSFSRSKKKKVKIMNRFKFSGENWMGPLACDQAHANFGLCQNCPNIRSARMLI